MANENVKLPVDKVVVFRMRGGPHDGEVRSDGDGSHEFGIDAEGLWEMTGGGAVGREFKGMSPTAWDVVKTGGAKAAEELGPIPSHRYEVVDRSETSSEIIVDCEYRQASA